MVSGDLLFLIDTLLKHYKKKILQLRKKVNNRKFLQSYTDTTHE